MVLLGYFKHFRHVPLIHACILGSISTALAVELPSGTSQILLQTAYPGETNFTLPPGGSITFSDTPVIGDNSQNWVFTNSGTLSATSVSTASGLQLDSRNPGATTVFNYGTLQTAGTTGSSAAGLRFMNGGQIINQPGAVIEGYDGIHSVNGFVQAQNYGLINGTAASGIFTNAGLRMTNYAGGTLLGQAFGARCFGGAECTLFNYGTISVGSIAVDFEGTGSYSLLNASSGVITGGINAVLFSSSNGQFINQGSLRSTNAGSIAVQTDSSGDVYVNAGAITGGGDAGTAMQVSGSGNTIYNLGTLTGSATALSLVGDNNQLVLGTHVLLPARGIDISGPGSITNGAITASGAGNSILLTDTGSEDTPFTGFSTLAMAGVDWRLDNSFSLNGTGLDSIAVQSGRLLMTGTVATSGGVTVADGGTLMVGNSRDLAAVLVAPGGAFVQPGGTFGGGGLFVGNVTNDGKIVTAANASGQRSVFTILGNVANGGLLDLTGGQPGNILTIAGNLASNGGRMAINTIFGGDGSATDRLVLISGTTTGTTPLIVHNAGLGDGALTVSGIRVVQTLGGATTAADAFMLDPLSSGYRVGTGTLSSGAFDYQLMRGSSTGAPNDWFLVSMETPSGGGGDNGGGRTIRLYRPEAGLYLANQAVTRTMFSMTLRDREGYRFPETGKAGSPYAGWARVTGAQMDGRVGQGSLSIDADSASILFGADLLAAESPRYGEFRFGIMGGFGKAQTTSTSRLLANYRASGDIDGYSVGVYGTWRQNGAAQNGAYADAWAQYNWFDHEVRGGGLPRESFGSTAVATSLELGYSFDLGRMRSWQVMLEPQVQAIYTSLSFDRLTERGGTVVHFQDNDGFAARIGGRLLGRYRFADDRAVMVFLEANWWRIQNNGGLVLNYDVVRPDLPHSFGEAKIGIQGEFAKNWTAWGQVMTQAGENNFRQIGGQIGMKYVW